MKKNSSAMSTDSPAGKEEQKENLTSLKTLNMDSLMQGVEDTAKQGPWKQNLANKQSLLYKTLNADVETYFSKRFTLFFDLAKKLGVTGDAGKPILTPYDLPMI